jgi:prepilin-type N-terminal cleavage/methylation domain-containing protein
MFARGKLGDEGGFSLPEILITIVIVGVTFSAILGGLMTSISVSAFHRKEATADALARSAAEWVKDDARNAYDPSNANSTSYSLGGVTVPGGFSVAISAVKCWDGSLPTSGSAYSLSSTSHFATSACTASDAGLQLIMITACSSNLMTACTVNGQPSETVEVLKRTMQ